MRYIYVTFCDVFMFETISNDFISDWNFTKLKWFSSYHYNICSKDYIIPHTFEHMRHHARDNKCHRISPKLEIAIYGFIDKTKVQMGKKTMKNKISHLVKQTVGKPCCHWSLKDRIKVSDIFCTNANQTWHLHWKNWWLSANINLHHVIEISFYNCHP